MNTFAISRMLGYFICCTVAVLLAGTISARLIETNAAWLFLAIGGAIGLLSASVKPLLAIVPGMTAALSASVHGLASFLLAAALLLGFRYLDFNLELFISLGGVVLGAGLAAGGCTFMYFLVDAADE